MRRTIILLLLAGLALLSMGGITPPKGGGGGSAPILATFQATDLAAGASTTGNATSWLDSGVIGELSFTSTASTSVSIELFRKDTHLAADRCLYISHADGQTSTWRTLIGTYYRDEDATTELHWKITNHGAAVSTIAVSAYGVGQ